MQFGLTDDEYAVWALHEFQGLTFKELAAMFGKSVGTMHRWYRVAEDKIVRNSDVGTTAGASPEDGEATGTGPGA